MVKKQYRIQPIIYSALFLLCLFPAFALAQDIQFTASVDRNRISINGQLKLTLIISGSQEAGNPELPSLDGFNIISQGSSSQFNFINGSMNASKSFIYTLMPMKQGILTIGAASIEVGGKIYKTKPITVKVLPAGKISTPAAVNKNVPASPFGFVNSPANSRSAPVSTPDVKNRIFIKVTTDKKEAYLGEQIMMTFKLYRRNVSIDHLQYIPPVTKGFLTESAGKQKQYREVVEGAVYDVIELKTAIFPVSAGVLTIGPANLKCDLLMRQYRKSSHMPGFGADDFFSNFFDNSLFGSYTRRPLDLKSNQVTVTVKSLPVEGKPASFKGAVGAYDLSVNVSPKSVKAGDPVNITMKLSGAGDINTIQEPVIKGLKGFKTYEPEVKTNITGRENLIAGEKIFQQMVVPESANIKEIPPIEFSWFDPLKKKYFTIKKGPFPITVMPAPKNKQGVIDFASGKASAEKTGRESVKLLAKDIQYIDVNFGKIFTPASIWYNSLRLWILIIAVPAIIFILSLSIQTHRIKLREDKAYAKTKGAYKTLQHILKKTETLQRQGVYKEFYSTLARALQKYISNKMNLPAGAVTINALSDRGISNDVIKRINALIDKCDMVRFGAVSFNKQDMKNSLKEALYLAKFIEKRL